MKTITIPARTRTSPEKTKDISPVGQAAVNLAVECAAEIDRTRERMSELAAKRADAIRTALDAGLSQADVSRLLGISAQAVNNILRQH